MVHVKKTVSIAALGQSSCTLGLDAIPVAIARLKTELALQADRLVRLIRNRSRTESAPKGIHLEGDRIRTSEAFADRG